MQKRIGSNRDVSRIGLGRWSIGGFMWGGTDEQTVLETIRAAWEHRISLIDTAPVYGFGRAEDRLAEDGWNSRDPGKVASVYTPDCRHFDSCR